MGAILSPSSSFIYLTHDCKFNYACSAHVKVNLNKRYALHMFIFYFSSTIFLNEPNFAL